VVGFAGLVNEAIAKMGVRGLNSSAKPVEEVDGKD
jgi:hypothetical protein